MKKTSNQDMLNAIREQATEEYQSKVPLVDGMEVQPRTILQKMEDYPTIKNEFIQTLVNKIVKTDFFSRVYSNPLKELKKGMMSYGATIEELFVMAAEAKPFFKGSTFNSEGHNALELEDGAADLMGVKKAEIKKLYITLNFAYFFKTSISDSQLKHAFNSANGLSELVNQITSSLINGAEQKEYKDMINLIKAVADSKQVYTDDKGLTLAPNFEATTDDIPLPSGFSKTSFDGGAELGRRSHTGVLQVMYKHNVGTGTQGKQLAKSIRTLTERMKFVNTKYNMAGVPTFTDPNDLIFMTTPEIIADMDVEVLASAFNVSSTDIKTRIIIVDELPTNWHKGNEMQRNGEKGVGYYYKNSQNGNTKGTTVEGDCLGLLMDKNFIQAYDSVNESRTFENGRSLYTNLFLHRQGMLANCYFSNCVALFTNEGYGKVKPHTAE